MTLRWVEVDLGAVKHNVRLIRKLAGPQSKFCAVVKSDAYGHGLIPCSRTILRAGVDMLAVTNLEEAVRLRDAGIGVPIFLMGVFLPGEEKDVVDLNLDCMVDSEETIQRLTRASQKSKGRGGSIRVHLKWDSGAGRWGARAERISRLAEKIQSSDSLYLSGFYTHLGYLPGKNPVEIEEAISRFNELASFVDRKAGRPIMRHVASSFVLMDFPHTQMNMVRIGNLLYGINLSPKRLSLKDPWKAYARIVSVRRIRAGESLGHESDFIAQKPMRLAVVSAGYADGVTLEPSRQSIQVLGGKRYFGWMNGQKIPFVGRVGMEYSMMDVTHLPQISIGKIVQIPVRRTAASGWPKVYKNR